MEPKYSANPVMFRNKPIGFILAILLIAAFGLGIVILLWWFLQCKSTKSAFRLKRYDRATLGLRDWRLPERSRRPGAP